MDPGEVAEHSEDDGEPGLDTGFDPGHDVHSVEPVLSLKVPHCLY